MTTSPHNTTEWKLSSSLVPYKDSLLWMEERVKAIQNKEAPECIWFLEHPPIYTLGASGDENDILDSSQIPTLKTGRGGKVTYHGPGQQIIYAMLDLNQRYRDVHRYVFELEEWIINTLKELGIKGERRNGRVGIWVEKSGQDHKIAAIGIRIQKWITSHGISLNIDPDLKAYDKIIPCGISEHGIISLKELGISLNKNDFNLLLREKCPFK